MKIHKVIMEKSSNNYDMCIIVSASSYSDAIDKTKKLYPYTEITSISICGETIMEPFDSKRPKKKRGNMTDMFKLYKP